MKAIILCSIGLLSLTFASCQKNSLDTDGTNIAKSVDNGYLNNTWIINDEDSQHTSETAGSITFGNMSDPTFTFTKDGHYSFSFVNKTTQNMVTQTGTYTVDKDNQQLILKGDMEPQIPNPSMTVTNYVPLVNWPNYTFHLQKLSEEEMVLVNSFTTTIKTTDTRGYTSTVTKTITETLYMEDND